MKLSDILHEPSHPEDLIYGVKNFINELSNVQERYLEDLVVKLNLTEEGADWLFDYIHNSGEEGEHITFEEYLDFYKKTLKDLTKNKTL